LKGNIFMAQFNMRLTAEDEKIINEQCSTLGISRAAFIRRSIRDCGAVADPELVKIMREYLPLLRRDSANVNQGLKYLHAYPNEKKYIEDFINDVVKYGNTFSNFIRCR